MNLKLCYSYEYRTLSPNPQPLKIHINTAFTPPIFYIFTSFIFPNQIITFSFKTYPDFKYSLNS